MTSRQGLSSHTVTNRTDRRCRPGRRAEILQAVMDLLAKADSKVTTAGLAAEVGLSEAALYRHFSGKAAIFQALTDYIAEHLLTPIESTREMEKAVLQELRDLYGLHLGFFQEHPGLCRIFLVQGMVTHKEGEQMVRVVNQYRESVYARLSIGLEKGELSTNLDLQAATDLYLNMLQGAVLRYVMSGFTPPLTHNQEASWKLFLQAVTLH